MSLVCETRTLDIICEREHDFDLVFLGLQFLMPQSAHAMSRGNMLWSRAFYKVGQQAYINNENQLNVWNRLVAEARQVLGSNTSMEKQFPSMNKECLEKRLESPLHDVVVKEDVLIATS
jgi:hypothetical protein